METNIWTKATTENKRIYSLIESVVAITPDRFKPTDVPHVSIIPGIRMVGVENREKLITDLKADMQVLNGVYVNVTGISFFPKDEPHVVMLDVEIPNLQAVRKAQRKSVETHGAEIIYDPVPAHITLAKADDGVNSNVKGLSQEQMESIEDEVGDVNFVVTAQPSVAEW